MYAPRGRLVSAGFFGYQPMITRDVVCAADNDMNWQECLDTVPPAIREINRAANHELFKFRGFVAPERAKVAYDAGTLVIGASHLPVPILGLTMPEMGLRMGEIAQVIIVLNRELFRAPICQYNAVSILEHELAHAAGVSHSDWPNSRMGAAERPWVIGFTPEDERSLRMVYGD